MDQKDFELLIFVSCIFYITTMPVDNNQKGVKNVQTLLAPKKPEAIDKDSAKEKPPKQNKRSHSYQIF